MSNRLNLNWTKTYKPVNTITELGTDVPIIKNIDSKMEGSLELQPMVATRNRTRKNVLSL